MAEFGGVLIGVLGPVGLVGGEPEDDLAALVALEGDDRAMVAAFQEDRFQIVILREVPHQFGCGGLTDFADVRFARLEGSGVDPKGRERLPQWRGQGEG
jgi:hypothetical protein